METPDGKRKFSRDEVLLVASLVACGVMAGPSDLSFKPKGIVDNALDIIREIDSRREIRQD